MWRSYFKTAIRNLRRDKIYAIINILGLGIGMACSILILLYIQSKLAVDRRYNDWEDIYRIKLYSEIEGQETNAPVSPAPMAEWMMESCPEVLSASRLQPIRQEIMFQREGIQIYVPNVTHADSNFFDVFSIPILHGD